MGRHVKGGKFRSGDAKKILSRYERLAYPPGPFASQPRKTISTRKPSLFIIFNVPIYIGGEQKARQNGEKIPHRLPTHHLLFTRQVRTTVGVVIAT